MSRTNFNKWLGEIRKRGLCLWRTSCCSAILTCFCSVSKRRPGVPQSIFFLPWGGRESAGGMEKSTRAREGRGSGVKRKDPSEMQELVCGPSGMFRPVRIIEWIWNKERQTLFLGCRGMCRGMSGEQIPTLVRHTHCTPLSLHSRSLPLKSRLKRMIIVL